ncbi:ATP-binding protein [Sporomusa sp. GT1]|uniref:ATP-binding protein n=1 Tax=Sporomusa sp. GT1 TaxID=1534747 RepID=UPI001CB7AEF1
MLYDHWQDGTRAILDRMLHHAYFISMRGDSYRLKERKAVWLYQFPAARSKGPEP